MSVSAAKTDAKLAPPGLWGTILTTTPVVLTVLATILAGLSNSEMTQAQYHRSLAAQYQSKAGDQWGFFQAKRIRQTTLETAADHLAHPVSMDSARLKALAHRLTLAMEHAANEKADDFTKTTAKEMKGSEAALIQELDKPEVVRALGFLAERKLPDVEEHTVNDAALDQALMAIAERKAEAEINQLVNDVPDKLLAGALAAAENNAQSFDDAGKPLAKTLDRVGDLVYRHVALAEWFLGDLITPLMNKDEAVRHAAEQLHADFAAARDRFNAGRYRRDADYNQRIAYLHEVQVHKSSVNSDRHRERSLHFFFGMLGAQAGVAISSMALAARNKSVLWALAGFLGLAALAFSGYVYLYY